MVSDRILEIFSFYVCFDCCLDLGWQISGAEFALVQVVQENANLRSKIVQSPDKLQVLVNFDIVI